VTDGSDRWHQWLLGARFGGDDAYRKRMLRESLYPWRDEILDKAHLRADDTLLDVGAGDGLIAFGAAAVAAKVMALYGSIQPMGTDPMMDFDDRDLVRGAEDAGFAEIFLELRLSVKSKKQPCPWERFLRMAGNPLVPPVGEVIDRALTAQEITEFSNYLKPLVESGTGKERTALAYLTAIKD
jgi:hypothetical protein